MYLKLGKVKHTMGKKIGKLFESNQSIRVVYEREKIHFF